MNAVPEERIFLRCKKEQGLEAQLRYFQSEANENISTAGTEHVMFKSHLRQKIKRASCA